jgi:hypothetical protein
MLVERTEQAQADTEALNNVLVQISERWRQAMVTNRREGREGAALRERFAKENSSLREELGRLR